MNEPNAPRKDAATAKSPWVDTVWSGSAQPGAEPAPPEMSPIGNSLPWAELATPPPRRGLPRIGPLGLILLLAGLVLVGGCTYLSFMVLRQQGQVLFTTTDPGGGNSCIVTNRVTAVDFGTHVWMVVMFKHTIGDDETVAVEVRHNGAWSWGYTWPVSDSKGRVCTWSTDLIDYPRGTWTFTFTHNGQADETGTLTIR